MNLLEKLFPKFRWRWVGSVEGICFLNTEEGRVYYNRYWNLYERGDGKRRFDVFGENSHFDSANVEKMRSQVAAWVNGGPLPPLRGCDLNTTPPKRKADLIVFPGGKGEVV